MAIKARRATEQEFDDFAEARFELIDGRIIARLALALFAGINESAEFRAQIDRFRSSPNPPAHFVGGASRPGRYP